jgi:hypothetical protein
MSLAVVEEMANESAVANAMRNRGITKNASTRKQVLGAALRATVPGFPAGLP